MLFSFSARLKCANCSGNIPAQRIRRSPLTISDIADAPLLLSCSTALLIKAF